MLEVTVPRPPDIDTENASLRDQLEQLRAENVRLRDDNRHLRTQLDAYIARAAAPPMYRSMETTAGTCVGPRPQRRRPREGSAP
jgi:hypothetical protein